MKILAKYLNCPYKVIQSGRKGTLKTAYLEGLSLCRLFSDNVLHNVLSVKFESVGCSELL